MDVEETYCRLDAIEALTGFNPPLRWLKEFRGSWPGSTTGMGPAD